MRTPRATRTSVVIGMVLAAAFLLSGCSTTEPPAEDASPSADRYTQVERTLALDDIRAWSMSTETKSTELASGFPVQVPVIEGSVTVSEILPVGPNDSEWAYTLATPHSYHEAVEWYARAYPIANWQAVSIREANPDGPHATTIEMVKGDARSTVTVREGDTETVVDAVIGLGTSAGETF